MNLSIQNSNQPEADASASLQSSNLKNSSAGAGSSTNTYIGAIDELRTPPPSVSPPTNSPATSLSVRIASMPCARRWKPVPIR